MTQTNQEKVYPEAVGVLNDIFTDIVMVVKSTYSVVTILLTLQPEIATNPFGRNGDWPL